MRKLISQIKRRAYLLVAGYFKFWANLSFRRWQPRVVAVTGSAGKTTMLNMIEQQFGSRAHYSHFANSVYGIAFDIVGLKGVSGSKLRWLWLAFAIIPMGLLFVRRRPIYVVEIDADRPKEAGVIASWLRPEVTVWVSLGRSHAANFDAQVATGQFENVDEAIADAFGQIAHNTRDLVIYDGTNELIRGVLDNCSVKTLAVNSSDLRSYKVFADHSEFNTNKGSAVMPYPMPKDSYKQVVMLGMLSEHFGEKMTEDLSSLSLPAGRNSYFAGKNGMGIIDSSYNAHLISMRSTLEMFNQIEADRKWLVLGDIIELGESEKAHHEELAQAIMETKSDKYILVGKRMRKYVLPILKKSKLSKRVESFIKTKEAAKYIESKTAGGELLLFKGSQYLEAIIEELLVDPADAKALVRQSKADKRRREAWEKA